MSGSGRPGLPCLLLALTLVGCSRTATPATAPDTVRTTSTTVATTTTLDRLAEVEAIIEELELRRLRALYEKDLEALRELYASEGLYEETIPVIDQLNFAQDPPWQLRIDVYDVLVDEPECLAFRASYDHQDALGEGAMDEYVTVLQPTGRGTWGYSFLGTGWLCDGPHPFEP